MLPAFNSILVASDTLVNATLLIHTTGAERNDVSNLA